MNHVGGTRTVTTMFSTDMLLTFATRPPSYLSLEGRFLVAKEALKVGEVIISEVPLFDGNTEAEKSRQATGVLGREGIWIQ